MWKQGGMNHTIENGIRGPAATIGDYSLLLGAVSEINLNEPPSKRPLADFAGRDNGFSRTTGVFEKAKA